MRRLISFIIAFPAFTIAASVSAQPAQRNFVAPLSGDEEVPPADTDGRGLARFQLSRDGSELQYKVIVANIENATMAHIGLGLVAVNGPVVGWPYPGLHLPS